MFRLRFRPAKGYGGDYGTNEWRRIESKEEALKLAKAARNDPTTRTYRPSKRQRTSVPHTGKNRMPVREKPTFQCGNPTPKLVMPQCANPAQLPRWGIPHYSRYLGVAREAPEGGAVASEPPPASKPSDEDRENAISTIMRSLNCSRAEAQARRNSIEDATAPPGDSGGWSGLRRR
jgi:hypothetical protein